MELEIQREIIGLARVSQHKIVSASDLQDATTALGLAKGLIKKIRDYFSPLKQDAHTSWKRICDRESEELGKITPTVTMLDRAIVDYRLAEERKRQAAEAERQRQEAERQRLAEKALKEAEEKERQAREAEARAAREKDAEARKKAQEEAARLQAAADKILTKAAAEESKLEPVVVVPEKVVTKGTAIRTYYRATIIDMRELIQAVAKGEVSAEALLPNMLWLNGQASFHRGQVSIPGVRIDSESKTVTTGRA